MKTILVVDAVNQFLRNYSVVPTLALNGEPNGGVRGFLTSLCYHIKLTNPDEVILVWDGVGGSKKRREIVPEYKLGRKPTRLNRNYDFECIEPEKNKYYQRHRLAEYLADLPVSQVCVDNIEADDAIAYLINDYYKDERVVLISGDQDFYQLLDKNLVIYQPAIKKFINWKYVYQKHNIHPKNFCLARAFIGDKSDNIAGLKGIGYKNILKYFPFFASEEKIQLEQVFSYCKDKGPKYERFLNQENIVIRNYKAMQLENPIVSVTSLKQIDLALNKNKNLNATSFRVKLIADGIEKLDNNFFIYFKMLMSKSQEK